MLDIVNSFIYFAKIEMVNFYWLCYNWYFKPLLTLLQLIL